jgi:hypothetical protein
MKTNLLKRIAHTLYALMFAVAGTTALTGCDAIMDDEPEPCPVGLDIRFVYDYNLERANAFPSQVDCLTVHFYDSADNYVMTRTETTDVLADENYRMTVDLPEGDYTIVAYGGVECDKASFSHTAQPQTGSRLEDLGMYLHPEAPGSQNEKGHLHDHFYGTLKVHVTRAPMRGQVTVKMMKNTNHFRFILQHMTYLPLDGKDYEFKITDDNTLFDHTNMLVDNGQTTYLPWETGAIKVGTAEDDPSIAGKADKTRAITEVQIAYADISTSRLMTMRSPRLSVTHKESGTELISIPLNNYLLALRNNHFEWCGDQEFLDRKSDWQLFFFLDDPRHWNTAFIKIDDWTVRINDIEQ